MPSEYSEDARPPQRLAQEIWRAKLGAPTPCTQVSYREYLEGLTREPRHLFLLHAIKHFRGNGEMQRNFWERYWNTRRESGDDPDCDQNYWERVWNMRQKAGRIITGLASWPVEFARWKAVQELHYYHGRGKCPAWLMLADEEDDFADDLRAAAWSRPKRQRKAS